MVTCPVQTRRVLLQQAAALQLERMCSLTLGQPVNYVSAAVDITDGNVATPNQNPKPQTIPQTSKPTDACSVTRFAGRVVDCQRVETTLPSRRGCCGLQGDAARARCFSVSAALVADDVEFASVV